MKRRHFVPALLGPLVAGAGRWRHRSAKAGSSKESRAASSGGRRVSRIAAGRRRSWGFAASISSVRPTGRCSRSTGWFRRCIRRDPAAPSPMP